MERNTNSHLLYFSLICNKNIPRIDSLFISYHLTFFYNAIHFDVMLRYITLIKLNWIKQTNKLFTTFVIITKLWLHKFITTIWGISLCEHSTFSSNELPDIHTTQTAESEANASVVTKWLHELLTKGHQSGNWRKPQMKDVSNLINICPINIIKVFWRLCFFPLNDIFDINEKSMLVLGPHGKNRKYSKDETNKDNPKVNRGCPPLTANHTSTDWGQNSHGPSMQYIPLGFSMLWWITLQQFPLIL